MFGEDCPISMLIENEQFRHSMYIERGMKDLLATSGLL
jgi:hypothetical protein